MFFYCHANHVAKFLRLFVPPEAHVEDHVVEPLVPISLFSADLARPQPMVQDEKSKKLYFSVNNPFLGDLFRELNSLFDESVQRVHLREVCQVVVAEQALEGVGGVAQNGEQLGVVSKVRPGKGGIRLRSVTHFERFNSQYEILAPLVVHGVDVVEAPAFKLVLPGWVAELQATHTNNFAWVKRKHLKQFTVFTPRLCPGRRH